MDKRQQQIADSFVRVRSFLDAHPASGTLSYTEPRRTLEDVIERLDEHAGDQVLGSERRRMEVRRQAEQIDQIYDLHMRPIVAIASAQIEPGSDVALPGGLRMPRQPLAPMPMIAACTAMIEAVRPFEALFISKGLPADFLAQFEAARDELNRMRGNKASQVDLHVSARAGLFVQLRRGRKAVAQLDSVVRASFRGDRLTLSAWRVAKRVHRLPSAAGELPVDVVTEAAA